VAAVKSVEQYIRAAPAETRPILRRLRAAIQAAAPEAVESISYGMPFYSYPGEGGIERRLCYFGLKRAKLGLYLRPKDLDFFAEKIAKFRTSKSALHFPLDQPLPTALVQTLVRGAARRHAAGTR
jgi:uncharacterized protein YdhG (YjbR/CyaY superfamily)